MNNATMQDIKNMNAEHLNNFFQQNSVGNIQVNETETDNISIHSLSESSDFDEDASEDNDITDNNDNQDEQDEQDEKDEQDEQAEDNISEISDDEDNESIEDVDDDEDSREVKVVKSDGLNILMQEEKNNPVRNKEFDIHTLSIEELNSNFKRPELFILCAKYRIKVNKREDKKGDLINRIVDFQKKKMLANHK
jgi:hypothetical protein